MSKYSEGKMVIFGWKTQPSSIFSSLCLHTFHSTNICHWTVVAGLRRMAILGCSTLLDHLLSNWDRILRSAHPSREQISTQNKRTRHRNITQHWLPMFIARVIVEILLTTVQKIATTGSLESTRLLSHNDPHGKRIRVQVHQQFEQMQSCKLPLI